MKTLNRQNFPGASYPEKILQFGEGNFLRAFIDWQIDLLNEHTSLNSSVAIVRPINTDFPPSLNAQEGLYTTVIRGIDETGAAVKNSRVIRSVSRELNVYQDYAQVMEIAQSDSLSMVFSNTTEAGITFDESDTLELTPPTSYPAKLTQFLYARYKHFSGADDKGLIIIPCELIDYNGDALKEIILRYIELWSLEAEFKQWIETSNTFCSTLVDRIVTGFPRDEHAQLEEELGYHDQFMDTAEYFYLFVIQGPQAIRNSLCLDELPDDVKMNILVVDDIKPYKERKVAILNGAHTAMVPVAYLAGIDTVGETMKDTQLSEFVSKCMFDEIIPTLDLPKNELEAFANDVTKRFQNPFIQHQLIAISLNSMTKFKTRILPQLLKYVEIKSELPKYLVLALSALITFYRGKRGDQEIPLTDDSHWLELYKEKWLDDSAASIDSVVESVLSMSKHWGQDLTEIAGLSDLVKHQVARIIEVGARQTLNEL